MRKRVRSSPSHASPSLPGVGCVQQPFCSRPSMARIWVCQGRIAPACPTGHQRPGGPSLAIAGSCGIWRGIGSCTAFRVPTQLRGMGQPPPWPGKGRIRGSAWPPIAKALRPARSSAHAAARIVKNDPIRAGGRQRAYVAASEIASQILLAVGANVALLPLKPRARRTAMLSTARLRRSKRRCQAAQTPGSPGTAEARARLSPHPRWLGPRARSAA